MDQKAIEKLANFIVRVFLLVWVVANVADGFLKSYKVPLELNTIMMSVVGAALAVLFNGWTKRKKLDADAENHHDTVG